MSFPMYNVYYFFHDDSPVVASGATAKEAYVSHFKQYEDEGFEEKGYALKKWERLEEQERTHIVELIPWLKADQIKDRWLLG